jgi:hypothetical protein
LDAASLPPLLKNGRRRRRGNRRPRDQAKRSGEVESPLTGIFTYFIDFHRILQGFSRISPVHSKGGKHSLSKFDPGSSSGASFQFRAALSFIVIPFLSSKDQGSGEKPRSFLLKSLTQCQ